MFLINDITIIVLGIIALVILVVLGVACVFLYKKGKQMQEKSESTQQQMRQGAQTQSLLIIDKKKMRLKEANFKKDKEILEEVLKHLRTMRDTWKEVMKKAGNKNTQ